MSGGRRLLAVNHTAMVSGAEAVMLRMLEAARDRGWDTAAAVPDGPLVDRLTAVGAEHVAIPEVMLPDAPPVVGHATLLSRYVAAARQLRAAVGPGDVIVANGLRVLPVLRAARLGVPTVWLAHSVLDRARWRRLVALCAPDVDLAVAVSQAVADSIPRRRFPVKVVWNGTPWPVAPAAPDPSSPRVLGCASLLTSWKGQDVLLEAVARLRRPDVVLELVGGSFPKDAGYVEALRRRSEQPDLAGRVRFVGRADDPLERMRRWSVAVVPSTDPEAGPLVLLEAMSLGVPAVATDIGGPREVLGQAGLLVPPGDPDALAVAIGRLLDDAELHRRCSQAGPRLVAAGLALDDRLSALLDAVEEGVGVKC